ncbi:hypothetical protein [Flavobacterium sp.]|uniref:hypothetical protein n=1 Tax=Flavobacterium sp. TaxID=239 RepID=UPI003D6AA9E1
MDRTLKVYTKTDHLFAEFVFHYDSTNQATASYIQYQRLYRDDEEDEMKSVYPLLKADIYLQFKQFDSIDQIKNHDIEVVKKELARDMTDPRGYTYVYDDSPILLRYVVANHIGFIGIVDVVFNFINNTKEVKFLSGTNPRFDFEISSNSLETNLSCILRIPVYTDRDLREIRDHELTKLAPWY